MDIVICELTLRHRINSVKKRGKHGTEPPLEELRCQAEIWLNLVMLKTPAFTASLEVECRRMNPSNHFYGTKVVRKVEFNPCAVELRVRPYGDPFQWACWLICPDVAHAEAVFSVGRPEAANYTISICTPILKETKEVVAKGRTLHKHDQTGSSFNKAFQQLSQRLVMRRIAVSINGQKAFSRSCLCNAISDVTGCKNLSAMAMDMLIVQLVQNGLIDPTEDTNFKPLCLFDELIEEHLAEQQQRECHQLLEKRKTIERSLRHLCHDRDEAVAKLRELRLRKKQLLEDYEEVNARLTLVQQV